MLERIEGGVQGIRIWWWDLWRKVLIDYYNRHNSSAGIIKDSNAYYDTNCLYSGRQNLVALYTLDEYPENLPVRYQEIIRESLTSAVYVRISFSTVMDRYTTPWNSAKVKSKLHTWQTIQEETGDSSAYTIIKESKTQDNINRREESLYYMADAEQRRNRKSFRLRTLMLVSGVRGPEFNRALLKVEKVCQDLGIRATRVTDNLDKYVALFSPALMRRDRKFETNEIGSVVLTDELVARFSNYTQGQVGSGPLYWGTDIYSQYPVWNTLKEKATDAENILIVAETGGGKSFFVKTLLLGILADSRFDATIMDIEGFEYTPLKDLVGKSDSCVQLNMGEGHGRYFDTVAVHRTGDPVLDSDMFGMSRSYTVAILKTLMGEYSQGNMWVDIIINDAVSRTYRDAGVTEDPETWKNSLNMTLKDVYRTVLRFYDDDRRSSRDIDGASMLRAGIDRDDVSSYYRDNEGFLDAKDRVVAQLSRYFEENGTRADVFRDPVGIDEIRDARVVICSFGLAGKTEKTVDPIQLALTQLFAANIAGLRSRFGQLKGHYSVKLWEEFQRWSGLPDSEKTIVTALTGGRKLGDVNIIITNKVSDLLNGDRFGVFESATSFAIGSIKDSKVRHELAKRLNIERLIPDLDRLVVDSESRQENALYRYAFVVHPRKGVETVTRMELPAEVTESPLFRTGVKEVDEDKETRDSLEEALSALSGLGIDINSIGLFDGD